jgi:hypothetical protein
MELLPAADTWLFPSENANTPLARDDVWRRNFLLRLKTVGLEWASFQVMRRTHASLMDDQDVDPQIASSGESAGSLRATDWGQAPFRPANGIRKSFTTDHPGKDSHDVL